ncbi:MAG: cysteine--tRNA ligase, partial [Alphaproteobacteria bacterium]|nr:cysteine--tRNA ligase [Alphaproteobacteria bacterium]
MTLQLHNTLTRTKEPFRPLDDKHVRMYVCGPTVYDDIHIGNARPLVVFDVIYRLLKHSYRDAKVTYVRNITDVDDKIIDRAAESGESIDSLTRRTTKRFHATAEALGCLKPDKEPRATDHIAQMKAMIETLIAKGHAYEAGGEVLFSVPSMPDYGKLSGRNRDEMIAGARVEVSSHKRDPADFILWKPSTGDQPGWGSDWGRGRPGWHIECSAMSEHYLGQQFDIHGGGVDLVFPHHENEIAQSLCVHPDETFAQVWMHNGYLMSEGEKMSKSLGNFYTVTELLEEFPGEALRLALLKTHYRQPLDFTKDGVR